MAVSVFDLFSVGIGPSSSHTVGPMRAAGMFVDELVDRDVLDRVADVRVDLFGSLAATGAGHGTMPAILLGLEGYRPDTIETDVMEQRLTSMRAEGKIRLAHRTTVSLNESDIHLHPGRRLGRHPNAMTMAAFSSGGDVIYRETYFSVGGGFVVTFQEREGDPFDPVRKRIESSTPNRLRNRGSDYLAYALIDAIVDSFFPLVESASDATDSIEEEMLLHARKEQVQLLHEQRRRAGLLQRTLWSLRDALAALLRSEAGYIGPETKVYLNDTLDHAIRLIELVDTQRDMTTGLIEMHLSLSQARTNDIISLLTIVSAIFIPLTFLVGVWGMNFDPDASPWNMPELRAYYGYPLALLFMAVVAAALLAFFKWKKWL